MEVVGVRMAIKSVLSFLLVAGLLLPAAFAQAEKPDEIEVGVFTFLSGPAATYGLPGRNAAELLFERINERGGIAGVPVTPIFVDEAQGLEGVLAEYRRLASDGVDAMIAALSSSNCLALAPVAEELQMLNLMWNCDTHRIFEEGEYDYVFRTNSNTIPEFVSAALYMLKVNPDVKTVAIINPDYAFGHDAAEIFKATLQAIRPDIRIVVELFPRLGAPDFSTEISRLQATRPDVIFSNLWGGDLNTFVRQANSRGLFRQSQGILALGTSSIEELGRDMPEGVLVGALGDGWFLSPEAQATPANQEFVEAYQERYGTYPPFPAYKMAQTILALEKAYHDAIEANGGSWPTTEQLAQAMEEQELDTFTGTLRLREDNDGMLDQVWGVTAASDEYPFKVLEQMVRFPAELVTPPAGVDQLEWVGGLSESILDEVPQPQGE